MHRTHIVKIGRSNVLSAVREVKRATLTCLKQFSSWRQRRLTRCCYYYYCATTVLNLPIVALKFDAYVPLLLLCLINYYHYYSYRCR